MTFADIPGAYQHTVAGREMWFKPATDGQLVLLQRFRMQIQGAKQEDLEKLLLSVTTKTLNLIDSLFLDPADRDFIEEQMLIGNVSVRQLMSILSRNSGEESDDDVVPVVRKKAVKKAQASKTANSRRGTR